MVELKVKITVVAVLVLFLVMFFIFLLHIYIKWYWNRRREQLATSNGAVAAAVRRRSGFTPGYQELAALRRGLDLSVLKTIHVVIFTSKHFKDGFECAVCLCQLIEGEKARFLPKCNHGFHVKCIDMWFQSHSSCPICRNLISSQSNLNPESTLESISILEAANLQNNTNSESHLSSESLPNFPTNVLFWGNDFEVRTLGNYMEQGQQILNLTQQQQQLVSGLSSSSRSATATASNNNKLNGGGASVFEVTQQVDEDEEEAKSPAQTRFRSLKKLLSKDNTTRVGPSSARDTDVEIATRS